MELHRTPEREKYTPINKIAMSKDKAEEKANNAQLFLIENKLNDLVISPLWCKDKVYVSDTLMKYTNSLSTENAQLRDILREIVELTDKMMVSQNDFEYNIASLSRQKVIDKARQLLTDKHKKI